MISGIQRLTSSLVNDSLTSHLDSTRICSKFVCDGLLSLNFWTSDLVKDFSGFDYSFYLNYRGNKLRFAVVACLKIFASKVVYRKN